MKPYKKYFNGFNIYDCIVGKNIVALLARENTVPLSEVVNNKIVIDNFSDTFGQNAGHSNLQHMPDMKGCLVQHPDPAFILVSSDGQVYKDGFEGDEEVQKFEDDIKNKTFMISNVKSINGKAYAVSIGREVFRRDDVNVWVNIFEQATQNKELLDEVYEGGGFNAIDGFSEEDIYAVGDDADCWHFNGSECQRLDLPVDLNLSTICCASDGFVYIGGAQETILKGKAGQWNVIQSLDSNAIIRKIVSFQENIYVSTFNGLFVLDGDELENISYINDFGYLGVNTNDTKLVTGGSSAAYVFDGVSWDELISD